MLKTKSHRSHLFFVLSVLLMTSSSAKAQAPNDESLEVSLQLDLLSPDGASRRPVKPGETLYAGSTIALRVKTSRDAHIYAAQVSPSGSTLRIFPRTAAPEQDVAVRGNTEISLPPQGGIVLDSEVGQENIIVVAALRPLQQQADERAQRRSFFPFAADAPAPPPPPPEAPRPPPQPLRPTDRVPPELLARQPSIARARMDRGGVVTVQWRFEHALRKDRVAATDKKKE